jgi:hypothetical protein
MENDRWKKRVKLLYASRTSREFEQRYDAVRAQNGSL